MAKKCAHAAIVAVLAPLAGGCSIHPLPSGLPRASTSEIVRNIRCEARDAIIKSLKNETAGTSGQRRTVNHTLLKQAAIAYEFTLDTTQMDVASLNLGLTDSFSNGLLGVGVGGSNTLSRMNSRNFRVVDEFSVLIDSKRESYCHAGAKAENWQYPIAGRIGLDEVVETFFQLNGDASLRDAKTSAPVFSDKLVFETTVEGSVTPSVLLSPVGGNVANRIRLGTASGSLAATRKDLHTVVVAMSLPLPKTAKPASRSAKASRSGDETILMAPFSIAPLEPSTVVGRSAKARAILELDRQEYRAFGQRLQR